MGTAKYGVNSYLVEFDPYAETQQVVIDTHKMCGLDATGYASQAKIHTRNNVGESGKIYFGTKQGYPQQGESRSDYLGGKAESRPLMAKRHRGVQCVAGSCSLKAARRALKVL